MKHQSRRWYKKLYKRLPEQEKAELQLIAEAVCGEHYRAALDYIRTDLSPTAIARQRHISEATLYRAVNDFFDAI